MMEDEIMQEKFSMKYPVREYIDDKNNKVKANFIKKCFQYLKKAYCFDTRVEMWEAIRKLKSHWHSKVSD